MIVSKVCSFSCFSLLACVELLDVLVYSDHNSVELSTLLVSEEVEDFEGLEEGGKE